MGLTEHIKHSGFDTFLDNPHPGLLVEIDLTHGKQCLIAGHSREFGTDLETMETLIPRYLSGDGDQVTESLHNRGGKTALLFLEVLNLMRDRGGRIYFDVKNSNSENSATFIDQIFREIDTFLANHKSSRDNLIAWIVQNVIFSGFDVLLLLELRRRFFETYGQNIVIHAAWTSDQKWSKSIDVFSRRSQEILDGILHSDERNWFMTGVDFCRKNGISTINVPSRTFLRNRDTIAVELIEYARSYAISVVVFVATREEMLQLQDLGIQSFEYA